MTEASRAAATKHLEPQLKNYWGSRILTQLNYLEELNLTKSGVLDALLDSAARRLAAAYETDGTITKQAALAIEEAMRPASALAKEITVSCVGHAHIDMNWMWRFDETAMITVDTLRTMLRLMREYPGFTFAQSQASVYKIIEEYAPELLPEIRARIAEGRWEVTASHWVETDKNMPSGESLSRHLLYTRQYLKQLLGLADDRFEIDFEPDTFGHGANVPEILRSGGVKYMYHCRGHAEHALYRWKAPSGAQVTVLREPTWYNETITGESFRYIPRFCAENKLGRVLHVYGVGDHGGGATRRDIERILDYGAWPCMPNITFGRCIDFFKYAETLDLPVVDHELNFIFDGCYTSQSRIKKANRAAEAALFESELFNAVSHQLGAYPYDTAAFARQWENVLFNHFHDILPGSGVIDTREHALGLFQQTMAGAGTRKSAALRAICEKINTAALLSESEAPKDSVAEGAGVGFGVGYEAGCESFRYTASNTAGGAKRLFVLFNPTQTVMQTASQLTVWDWDGDSGQLKITDDSGRVLEHELIDQSPKKFWTHEYFRVHVLCELPPFGYRTVLLEEDSGFKPLGRIGDQRVEEPAEYVLENAHVKAVFDQRTAALLSFVDKSAGREYIGGSEGALFRYIEEDTDRGMTAWRVGRRMSDTPAENVKKLQINRGGIRQWLSYEAQVHHSKLQVEISLDKNACGLAYAVTCDWREFGAADKGIAQLAFRLPLAYDCDTFLFDNAFGVIERPARDGDVPGQSFGFAPRGGAGIMLSSDSKYGYRCAGNAMSLRLIRSSYNPDPAPEIYTHTFNMHVGIVENKPQRLVEAAQSVNHPAVAVACGSQRGALPPAGVFVRIAEGDAVISSVKMAEDGSGTIVRLYNVGDKDSEAALEFLWPMVSMVYVDAHETELGSAEDGKIRCKAKCVTAVKIRFGQQNAQLGGEEG